MRLFRGSREPMIRVYYASDIHGTEVLWKKFLNAPKFYDANVLVMGGDITGKVVVPLVSHDGGVVAEVFGRTEAAVTDQEIEALEARIRGNGMYPQRMSTEEVARVSALPESEREAWFERIMLQTFAGWVALADERLEQLDVRCFVMPGNDDPPSLDVAIERGRHVEPCDGKVVEFDGYTMLSVGHSNRTPWNSPREVDEDELYARIAALAEQVPDTSRCVFNLHAPPYRSGLDTAVEVDEELRPVIVADQPHLIPVGSTAVREAIETFQPLAALHGHIHESRAAARIGRTICINPGSDYATGRIAGCLVNLRDGRATYQFVDG
ncbi:MAG: metallophosphoesterase [Actinomycetota bacterium]|nr:metallophosphoesterase [Actinomycetota bacterium]